MIVGIGTDISSFEHLKKKMEQMPTLLCRLFTDNEISYINQANDEQCRLGRIAKRFSAKEAFAKALGVGIGDVSFLDIEVCRKDSGMPFIRCSKNVEKLIKDKMPNGFYPQIHLSLSDDNDCAIAFVVIEAVETLNNL